MIRAITDAEAKKYRMAWEATEYSDNPTGLKFIDFFMKIANPAPGQTVLDIGCGEGVATEALKAKGLAATGFDLVGGDIQGCVWRDLPCGAYDYGYCTDVVEHLPTQFVALAIDKMLQTCGHVFFSIPFHHDIHGATIREQLHLTVQPFTWWRDTLRELGELLEARDLQGHGVFYLRGLHAQ